MKHQIQVLSEDRVFSAPYHFVVMDKDHILVSAAYVGLEMQVKAIGSSIIEGRVLFIDDDEVFPLIGKAYRRREKPIGLGDVFHGMILTRRAVWGDILEDEVDESIPNNYPVILVFDGELKKRVGRFLVHRFHLPTCWEDRYYDLLEPEKVEELIVRMNPDFNLNKNLKAVRIRYTEKEILKLIEENLVLGMLPIPKSEHGEGVFEPDMTLKEFLKANSLLLSKKLESVSPYFDPKKDSLHWSIRKMKRTPFPVQSYKIQALTNALMKKQKTVFDVGDMGTGKSISACGIVNTYHEMKKERGKKTGTAVLLSAPAITLPKWKEKEIEPTLANAKVEIIHSTEDALRLLRKIRSGYKPPKDRIDFYIVGLDRAKLGAEPHFSGVWKRGKGGKEYYWHCPDCGRPIEVKVDKEYEPATFYSFVEKGTEPTYEEIQEARRRDLTTHNPSSDFQGKLTPNGVPYGHIKKWKYTGSPQKCLHCGAKLWRPALKSLGETRNRPRYNISLILRKAKKWFDFFIQDEVQMTRAEDSARGDAFAQLMKTAKKAIFLTGTLTTGKSTSIKEILWRSEPRSLLAEGFNHETGMVQWAKRYGKLKEIYEVEEVDLGYVTRRRRKALQPKEEPGISPTLVTNHLLHKAAFTELADLTLPLVKISEIPMIIPLDEDHKMEYTRFHQTLRDVSIKLQAWGKFIPATIQYADRPEMGMSVRFRGETGEFFVTAPPIPKPSSKLRTLIDIVKKELDEDRGVIIYNRYTDSYGMNEYIQVALEREGISSDILSSHTTPDERFEWLNDKAEKNRKVIITNMSLVEVGLDLLPWPTIIYYQLDYDINKIRQSSRRSWRIGQEREVRVYYLIAEGTQNQLQFETLMAKRGHALLVEGRIDRSELAKYSRDQQNALTTDLAGALEGNLLTNRWQELAGKDMDDRLNVVDEKVFKETLRKRMEELKEITLSLCLPLPEGETVEMGKERTEEAKVPVATNWSHTSQIDLFHIGEEKSGTEEVQSYPYELVIDDEVGRRRKKRNQLPDTDGQLAFKFF